MEQIISMLPDKYAAWFQKTDCSQIEEIRFSVGQPVLVRKNGMELLVWPKASQRELEELLLCACRQSVYAYTQTLRQGFITTECGHRIGICGFGVMQDGVLQNIRTPSSLVIRIARQIKGCGAALLDHTKGSILLLGPPGSGKTTLLRDLVRLLSDEKGKRVGLVDERGEISSCIRGTPQLEIGLRTDVIVNVPKAQAFMMLLRTMTPQWIAVDEITTPDDVCAIEQASYCGVEILATAHGSCLEDLYHRPIYQSMMEKKIFKTIVILKPDKSWEIQVV